MGNRAVIATEDRDIGIYLHWNGGRDSINAFLAYCNMKGYRKPEQDNYGWVSLCNVISNFFGGYMSIGIDKYEFLDRDNYDNGVYIIKDWNVIGRVYYDYGEEQNSYDLREMVYDINDRMPQPLSKSEIDAWIDTNGSEYNFCINKMPVDEDKKADRFNDVVIDKDGRWSTWYIGYLDGIDETIVTRKKILDTYAAYVCICSNKSDKELIDYIYKELV